MNYGIYHDRKPGDRVIDKGGKIGIVTEIYGPHAGRDAIAVRWDDGTPTTNLIPAGQFRLLSRVNANPGKLTRPKLADMLKQRVPRPHHE